MQTRRHTAYKVIPDYFRPVKDQTVLVLTCCGPHYERLRDRKATDIATVSKFDRWLRLTLEESKEFEYRPRARRSDEKRFEPGDLVVSSHGRHAVIVKVAGPALVSVQYEGAAEPEWSDTKHLSLDNNRQQLGQ